MIIQCKGPTTVASFKTIKAATEATGAKNVKQVLEGKFKTSNGFEFKEVIPECPTDKFHNHVMAMADRLHEAVNARFNNIKTMC